jgi:hypothetical protein
MFPFHPVGIRPSEMLADFEVAKFLSFSPLKDVIRSRLRRKIA